MTLVESEVGQELLPHMAADDCIEYRTKSDKTKTILDFKIAEYNSFYKLINPFAEDGTPLPNMIKDLVAYNSASVAIMGYYQNPDQSIYFIDYCAIGKKNKKDINQVKRCFEYLFNGLNAEYPRIIDRLNNINDSYRITVDISNRGHRIFLNLRWKIDTSVAIEKKDLAHKNIMFTKKSCYTFCSLVCFCHGFGNFKEYKFVLY